MTDQYGRKIKYLRLSVTDLCSCRCVYCMGAEGVPKLPHEAVLSFEEIEEIVRAAVSLGVRKVRLTGGEPLVRRGIDELVRRLRAIEGIRELAMTTNGARLAEYAERLKSAGLDRLNVSLDTLDPEKYRKITRIGSLSDTLAGLDAARSAGFTRIKLNAVLMGGVNDDRDTGARGACTGRRIRCALYRAYADWRVRRLGQKTLYPGRTGTGSAPKAQRVPSDGVAELWRPEGLEGHGRSHPAAQSPLLRGLRPHPHHPGRNAQALPALRARDPAARKARRKRSSAPSRRASGGKPKEHHITDGRTSDSLRGMNRIGG